MQTYFHCCPLMLAPGSIVEKGNWGRVLKMFNRAAVGDQLMREYVLEKVRALNFPKKPSRFNSIFLCRTLQEAQQYRANTKAHTQLIYEVEVLSPAAAFHKGDYKKASPEEFYLRDIEVYAAEYWQDAELKFPEVVIESDIKILKKYPD